MKHLDVSPDTIERLAFENPDACITFDTGTRRMHIEVDGDTWVSTPLPVLGQAS